MSRYGTSWGLQCHRTESSESDPSSETDSLPEYSQCTDSLLDDSHYDGSAYDGVYSEFYPDGVGVIQNYNASLEPLIYTPESRSETNSIHEDSQYAESLHSRYDDPAYHCVYTEPHRDEIVRTYDTSLGLLCYRPKSSDNDSWRSGTNSLLAYSHDTDSHLYDDPAYYGVSVESHVDGKYQYSNPDSFQRDWNKIAKTEENMGFKEAGSWRICRNPRMALLEVPFPKEVFGRDPNVFPWSGYKFDAPSFGFWIYCCAEKIETLHRLDVALGTYNCLYELGNNEQDANSLTGKMHGRSENTLRLWLRECSTFITLFQERVGLCYNRLPPGGTDCYPGFFIAKSLYGCKEHIAWVKKFIGTVNRLNQKFSEVFGWRLVSERDQDRSGFIADRSYSRDQPRHQNRI